MSPVRSVLLVAVCVALAGCGSSKVELRTSSGQGDAKQLDTEAAKFLKRSMNQYAALKSYEASVSWSMGSPGSAPMTEKRTISVVIPNRFKVVTKASNGLTFASVSDGRHMLEYVGGPNPGAQGGEKGEAQNCDVPSGIATAESSFMNHPVRNGTPLYQFFRGSDGFDGLVDVTKGPVAFGGDAKGTNGETGKTVTFYGAGGYGNVKAVIGEKTGLIYSIQYDNEGVRERIRESGQQVPPELLHSTVTERYSDIKTNSSISPETFDTRLPKGIKMRVASNTQPPPPIPIGKPAPDVTLTGLDGKKLKLSSLKGNVVMIDFWATWCKPCRKGLPITNKMYETYKSHGLKVLTVSNEDSTTVTRFIQANGYTFPAYLDSDNSASVAYHVQAIPTLVILDAKGNLSSYTMGLDPAPETSVLANLKKAGLKQP